jgi:hypothetical protein
MYFFNKTPKSQKFYTEALKYLDNHKIKYVKFPEYKMKCLVTVKNIETKKTHYLTLKIDQNKFYVTIKGFIEGSADYTKQVEFFEDFTTIVYKLRFDKNNEIL